MNKMSAFKNLKLRRKNKPFAAIEIDTVDSDDWKKLTRKGSHVYNTLKTFYRGSGDSFKAPFKDLMRRTRIEHPDTLDVGIRELEENGWIEVTRYAKHGKRRGLRVKANEYRLTFKFDKKRW